MQIQLKSDKPISALKGNFTAISAVFLLTSFKSCLIISNNFNTLHVYIKVLLTLLVNFLDLFIQAL